MKFDHQPADILERLAELRSADAPTHVRLRFGPGGTRRARCERDPCGSARKRPRPDNVYVGRCHGT